MNKPKNIASIDFFKEKVRKKSGSKTIIVSRKSKLAAKNNKQDRYLYLIIELINKIIVAKAGKSVKKGLVKL